MTEPSLLGAFLRAALGLGVLTGGAELLVRGASGLALRLRVPALLVGLTVVSLGTSAPEIAVSTEAALVGRGDVALGNVVGSNIFNALVVLGASAVVTPLIVGNQLVRLDVPVMVAVSALPLFLGMDGTISRADGLVLLALLGCYLLLLARLARTGRAPIAADVDEIADGPSRPSSLLPQLAAAVGGAVLLVFGADALVEGATTLARSVGVSDLVIGLTLVAAGTSLPELATSVSASLRGERDLAVGNVVGSNIFNILAVLGVGAAVGNGMSVAPGLLRFDFPVMLGVAVACLPVFLSGSSISRREGAVFLLYYVLYAVYLGLHTADHPYEEEFGAVVLGVVLPMTVLLAAAVWSRRVVDRAVSADGGGGRVVDGPEAEPADPGGEDDRGRPDPP